MPKVNETILSVQGMTCPSCIRHVDQALCEVDGVDDVEVRLKEGKVVVRHEAASLPVRELIDALGDAGYEAKVAQK